MSDSAGGAVGESLFHRHSGSTRFMAGTCPSNHAGPAVWWHRHLDLFVSCSFSWSLASLWGRTFPCHAFSRLFSHACTVQQRIPRKGACARLAVDTPHVLLKCYEMFLTILSTCIILTYVVVMVLALRVIQRFASLHSFFCYESVCALWVCGANTLEPTKKRCCSDNSEITPRCLTCCVWCI